ncbi:hypothetical protein LINPERPRIM_LOCUS12462 [Linum perenne]
MLLHQSNVTLDNMECRGRKPWMH